MEFAEVSGVPPSPSDHVQFVSQWIARTAAGLSSEQLSQLLDDAVNALWKRSDAMFGEATLTATMKRVLHYSVEQYPFFKSVRIHPGGIDGSECRTTASEDELRDGMLFMLVGFLTVIGNLTGNVLANALYSELSKVSADAAGAPVRSELTSLERTS